MKKFAALLAVLVSLVICSDAGAVTYYVAQTDPKASDDNSGAEAVPWKTVTRSLKTLQPGDTVYIKKGTYREYIVLSPTTVTGGKSYAPMLSFIAFPGDQVIIKGSNVLAGWKLADSAGPKQAKGKVYVTDGLPNPGAYSLLFCDGKRLELIGDGGGNLQEWISTWGGEKAWKGIKGKSLDDLERGSCFYDRATKKLYVWLADGGDPGKHLMEAAVRGGLDVSVDYVRLSGLRILHGSASLGGNYDIMEDCESSDSTWNGLGIQGKYNTIIRCKFNRCGDTGICGSGRGHRFIHCETSYNNFLKMSPGWHAGGVKIISQSQGFVFDGHTASYNQGDGIWFDNCNFDTIITNCVSHHNTGSGIFHEISERAAIMNNVCYENGCRGVYLSNCSDCQVLNNIFYHNGMSGVACIGINRGYGELSEGQTQRLPARNNVVWGNLFVDNCHPDLCLKEPDGRDKPWDTRAELILPETKDNDINTGNVSDYNIIYRSPGRVLPFWIGWHQVQYKDIDEWRAKTGNDKHSIVAQPLFVDAQKYDFRPAKGSPAIDFVKPRMGCLYDFSGALRPTDERPDRKPARLTAGPFEFEPPRK